ncbi:MAG TPA: hypothetical protein VGR29_00055, partial [Thermomicrobiales bacterium]|nr:hypothetical protein [Thermomicrobiales bacterium]
MAAHRRLVAVVSLMSLVVAIIGIVLISPNLSADGFVSEQAESARVDEALAREFGHGSDSLVFLFDANRLVSDPAVQRAVEGALAPITADARFGRVLTTWSTGDPRMVSETGTATYAVAVVAPGADVDDAEFERFTGLVTDGAETNG